MVQQCIVHLIRKSFRYAGRRHRDAIVKSLTPVYTTPATTPNSHVSNVSSEWCGAPEGGVAYVLPRPRLAGRKLRTGSPRQSM